MASDVVWDDEPAAASSDVVWDDAPATGVDPAREAQRKALEQLMADRRRIAEGRAVAAEDQAMRARQQAAADAYRPVPPQGLGETLVHKGAQGATLDWLDELTGKYIRNKVGDDAGSAALRMPDGTMRFLGTPDGAEAAGRDAMRQKLGAMDDQRPVVSAGAQLAGGLSTQAMLAAAGLPVFGAVGQAGLAGLEGVGQAEHGLDTTEGKIEALVRGGGNAALGGALGKIGGYGPKLGVEAQADIARLLGPARSAFRAAGDKVETEANDLARQAVLKEHAKDLAKIAKRRAEIGDKIYREFADTAHKSGVDPKLLGASEKEIQDAIEAKFRKDLHGSYSKANKAGILAAREKQVGGVDIAPENAETLQHFAQLRSANANETLAKGIPTPPVRLTPEQMREEVVKQLSAAKAKGVRAVEKKYGDSPVMDPAKLQELVDARIKALQDSGALPAGRDLSLEDIEGLTAVKLGDPAFLESKNMDLARKVAAGRPPLPPDAALAEGLSERPKYEVAAAIADMLPGGGIKGRLGKRVLKAVGSQTDRGAFEQAVRNRAVSDLLAKYGLGPQLAAGVRELATDESDDWTDAAARRLR